MPITVLDGEIILTSRYPTNAEFVEFLNVPMNFVGEQKKSLKVTAKKSGGCGCKGGSC